MSSSMLTWSIPKLVFTHLANLEIISLTDNLFEGSLPVNISNLSKPKELYLEINKFSGSSPHEIGLLHALQVLELSENLFEGSIPSSLGQLRKI